MATPQPGIFAQGTRSHYHLEFDLRRGADPAGVAAGAARLREPHVTAGGANLVVGFGADLWRVLAPDAVPPLLAPFTPIEGDGRRAPATQHDVWVWLHGTGPDLLLDMARLVTVALGPELDLAAEQPCFVYRDSRDLTGFVDGTENPPVEEAPQVAVIPDGPGAGGSYAMTMRWVHDLAAFDRLSVPDQEAVIGRTKTDSVELDDKPPTAHISRVVVEEGGEELEIYRRSVPYGRVTEHGLYFVAFSADRTRFDRMLARMFGTTGDGLHDHLTDFSRPVGGSYYFAPPLEALATLG
ncbi:MAG TPA: Dyp-type peroxidase [Acidimicrobiia bacterium]|nr:Dyp-type peroxidase [Acidimicrobiia bacterium]